MVGHSIPSKDAHVVGRLCHNEVNDTGAEKMITQVWEESAVFVVDFSLALSFSSVFWSTSMSQSNEPCGQCGEGCDEARNIL